MNKIRSGVRSLLSRSCKKDVTSKKTANSEDATERRGEESPNSPQISKKKSFTAGNAGFNVFQARIYTKGDRNNYHYSPVPEIKHPEIKYPEIKHPEIKQVPTYQLQVDPPDDIPFKLNVDEEQYRSFIISACSVTPPASPTLQSEFRKPHLKINTNLPGSWTIAPLSPPISAGAQASETQLPINQYEYQSPTRAPPSPPIPARQFKSSPLINASDDVLIHIFSNLDSLSTMESLALTHSRFNNVLAPNKLYILRGIINNISPSASNLVDLLRSTDTCTAKSYSEDYAYALEVVTALKVLIQSRCRFFLKPEKLDFHNISAERAFNDALYNIWAFCITFRDQVGGDVEEQMEWLRRFKLGELLDILEIWQCLGVLLRPLVDCPELARKYGVIKSRALSSNYSTEVISELEEWIAFVQTQGLDILKPIVEWSEKEHTQRYTIIVAKGLHKWQKLQDRKYSMFLKDAANKVYRDLSLAEETKFAPISPVGSWGPTTDF